jgi:hypothetical protein
LRRSPPTLIPGTGQGRSSPSLCPRRSVPSAALVERQLSIRLPYSLCDSMTSGAAGTRRQGSAKPCWPEVRDQRRRPIAHRFRRGDLDAVRNDLRSYVAEHLGDLDGVLIVDDRVREQGREVRWDAAAVPRCPGGEWRAANSVSSSPAPRQSQPRPAKTPSPGSVAGIFDRCRLTVLCPPGTVSDMSPRSTAPANSEPLGATTRVRSLDPA